MKWLRLIQINAVVATVDQSVVPLRDACFLLHVESFCGEDGNCANLFHGETRGTFSVYTVAPPAGANPIACIEAYILSSRDVVVEVSTPPMIGTMSISHYDETRRIYGRAMPDDPEQVWPSSIDPPNVIFVELCDLLSLLYEKLNREYPFILSDPDLFFDILTVAEAFKDRVITPSRQSTRNTIIHIYNRFFAHLTSVRGINAYMRMIINHIYSLPHGSDDGTNSLRAATFRHFVPFLHLWHRVLSNVGLPFISTDYEFLESATKFEPAYLSDDPDKSIWYIQVHSRMAQDGAHVNYAFPVIPPGQYSYETFPLSILEALETRGVVVPSHLGNGFQADADGFLADTNFLWRGPNVPQHIRHSVRSIIFFLVHYPGVDGEQFCRASRTVWLDLISLISRILKHSTQYNGRSHGYPELIEFVRLCAPTDPEWLSLDFRVRDLLPALVGVRFRQRTIPTLTFRPANMSNWFHEAIKFFLEIPPHMFHQRFIIRYDPSLYVEGSEFEFMHLFVSTGIEEMARSAATTSSYQSRIRRALGIVMALLVVEGDNTLPVSLSSFSRFGSRKIYLNSESVRNGFCKVLNCVVFDTLFENYDLQQVLDVMARHKPLHSQSSR